MRALSIGSLLGLSSVFLVASPLHADDTAASASSAGEQAKQADAPLRQGFTLELGLGLARTTTLPDQGTGETRFGLAPLSASLGGFLTRDFSLAARIAGTSYFVSGLQVVSGFYGVTGDYWIDDDVFVGAGAGLALFGANPFIGRGDEYAVTRGFGTTARAGYAFASGRHHVFSLSLDVFPSFFKEGTVVGSALNLNWQWF